MRLSALLIALSLMLVGCGEHARSYTFLTGAPRPVLNSDQAGIVPPLNWDEYLALVRSYRNFHAFVPIRQRPRDLTSHALYGLNFVTGNQNRSWILDSISGKWFLYLDWKGDGDLSHVTPSQFKNADGVCRLDVLVREGRVLYPGRFEILPHYRNSHRQMILAVSIDQTTERSGQIDIGGRTASFALMGQPGFYNSPGSMIMVHESDQWQQYHVGEAALNLFGKSYAFCMRPDGSALVLTELPRVLPQRASLRPGSQAPEFAVKDISGVVQSLSSYRGRTVLLDFWSTFCGPCRSDEPRLVKFYRATRRSDFSILGITSDSSISMLRQFVRNANATWPQVIDAWDGPLHRGYRAFGLPTYYLIGSDGKILTTWSSSDEIRAHLRPFCALMRQACN